RLIISQSNKALHTAKQVIFSLHRDQISDAKKLLASAETILINLGKHLRHAPDLKHSGAYKAALEEYVEAQLFFQVLQYGTIKRIAKPSIRFDDYIAGLCDFTGELIRKMVLLVTKEDVKKAQELKEIIADVVSGLIKLDLTGYLRNKFDAAKRNLKKAEEIMYNVKIKGR
ncbi:hypothetical protein MYX07_07020, partial [Patescibacteria group bacterium AH-259-L07]|nr:hypothetical protein [Patescibacteria group bacterium AH-259-L07]